jgi:hypothetical protein
MLRIVNIEEIQNYLLQVPELINSVEKQETEFISNLKNWLSGLEKVLHNNNMSETGNIASYRGILISASRGCIPNEITFYNRLSKRKIIESTATFIIQQSSNLVSTIIQKDKDRFFEAERFTQQLVTIAKTKGLIKEPLNGNYDTDLLKHIWKSMSSDKDLSPGVINIEGLIGPYDALIILNRVITSNKLNI